MTSALPQLLVDPLRSGVYRAARPEAIEQAARGARLDAILISLHRIRDKASLLRGLAAALAFPDWFGENWDALEDCLADLSWREDAGRLLLVEGFESLPQQELDTLVEVMGAAAAFWADQRTPFFAVFVDPQRRLALAEL